MMSPEEFPLAVSAFREAASCAGHSISDDVAGAGIRAASSAVVEARVQAAVRGALAAARPAPKLDAGQYEQLLSQEGTVSLEQFRAMEEYDGNVFWRLDSGHIQNLLDAALEHNDVLARALEEAAER